MKLQFFSGLILSSLIGSSAFANIGIGVVDLQKAVQSTTAGKKARETMEAEFKKRKDQLDKKKADIDKMAQDLEKKRSVLSEEIYNKRNLELQEEMMKFQKTVAENQGEIQKKERDVVEPILEKMRKTVDKIAAEKKLDVVLERQGNSVLFAKKEIDITEDVSKAFEKEK